MPCAERRAPITAPIAALIAALAAPLLGCHDATPPAIPPVPYIPIPPLAEPATEPSASAPLALLEPSPASSVAPLAPSLAPPVTPPVPPSVAPPVAALAARVRVMLETPHKLGRAPQPASREAYLAAVLEARRWNDGGIGDPPPALPPPEGHPDPRVIVDVDRTRGSHRARVLEREARKSHWMSMVRCYRLGAYKDPELSGVTRARIEVRRDGKVTGSRLLATELDDRAVARCMVDKLRELRFPAARSGSSAWLSMRIGPGDDPLPPPEDQLLPGSGELSVEAMKRGVEAGLGAFEACYRDALGYAPALWGRIVLRIHVSERGALDEAFEGGSRFPDKRMLQCVLRAARKLSFERPTGGDLRFLAPVRFFTEPGP